MQRMPEEEIRDYFSNDRKALDNNIALEPKKKIAKEFKEQLIIGNPTNQEEIALKKLSKQLKEKRVVVKLHLKHTLHAKLYLAHRDDYNSPTIGFVGSSNLTFAGISKHGELNVDVVEGDAAKKLSKWYQDRWEDRWSIDITEVLAQIMDESWATEKLYTPYHVYLKIDYHLSREARAGISEFQQEVQEGISHELEDKLVEAFTQPHLWEIRKTWNQKAPENIGLPTEIYRELIERRKSHADLKAKIDGGEITRINDFITYNLNIRQFSQDFIENTEDAAFIRHFYKSIAGYKDQSQPKNSRAPITILDPTCGSGAFLFAALNILEPLYEACIIRMEQLVEEQPGKHKFFEETLFEVKSDQHPSLQYFIFKSIILNNLYGVDIMNEAVEIAKLHLFLKLVATVDVNPRNDNFGLEPLPDIDFNIRTGNTLIGFATKNELLQSIH